MSENENKNEETPEESKAEETKAEETKAEETKAEEPKAEETPAEEPKAEETPAEEPKAEETPAEEPKAEETKAEEPKAEETKAEETPAEEPKAEETPAEEPAPVAAEPEGPKEHFGILLEFESATALMKAAEKVRDAGFTQWDSHTPFPVHGLDKAMGIKPTILPWLAFGGGLTGCLAGLCLQVYTNGIELPFSLIQQDNWIISEILSPFLPSGYAYVTSGKPIFSIPANIPVLFELTILLAAFGTFFGMLGLNQLPRFWHPVFSSERFKRASSDRFFISLEAGDPLYHEERTKVWAEGLSPAHIDVMEG